MNAEVLKVAGNRGENFWEDLKPETRALLAASSGLIGNHSGSLGRNLPGQDFLESLSVYYPSYTEARVSVQKLGTAGMTEEIINRLSDFPRRRVRGAMKEIGKLAGGRDARRLASETGRMVIEGRFPEAMENLDELTDLAMGRLGIVVEQNHFVDV